MKLVDAPNKKTTGKSMRSGGPLGIVVHHTASSKKSKDENVIQMCIRGVNKVPGPLYHYLISADGTVWQIAGENVKANHAGRGNNSVLDGIIKGIPVRGKATTPGKISANSSLVGVSLINDGLFNHAPEMIQKNSSISDELRLHLFEIYLHLRPMVTSVTHPALALLRGLLGGLLLLQCITWIKLYAVRGMMSINWARGAGLEPRGCRR